MQWLRPDPPRIAALTEALKNDDLYTRNSAAEALAQIGPEARPAVPALIDLWWRSYGLSLVQVADDIQAIEPGALQRARLKRCLARSAIAGILLALPLFAVLRLGVAGSAGRTGSADAAPLAAQSF